MGKWKHPQGITSYEPEQRVVLHVFFVQIHKIMKKYQNEAQRTEAMAKAQEEITRFLKHEYGYVELMRQAAKAQLQIAEILSYVDQDEKENVGIRDIHKFFFFAIRVFDLLKPFTEYEIGWCMSNGHHLDYQR